MSFSFDSIMNNIGNMGYAALQAAEPTPLDKLGYIPVVGTVSGVCRIVYGLAKAIFSAFAYIGSVIFASQMTQAKWEFRVHDGRLHFLRGIVELIPFIGGALTNNYDKQNAANRMAYRATEALLGA